MPPKSKKEVKNIQKKVIEDKTFGLKNKNKSKVVQQFVQQVTQSAMRAGLSKDEAQKQERMRQERAAKKEAKIQQEKEDAILFNPAVKKKLEAAARKKKEAEEAAAAAAAAEGPEIMTAEEAYLDAKREGELARAEAVLGMQQDDDVLDQIERERTELRKQGGLTPVTFDSFVAWKAKKAEERKAQELQDTKNAIAAAAKMRGKSGRDMFNALVAQNADLFLDDDDADDDWMKRDEEDEDDVEVFDVQVTGTTLKLNKVEKAPAGKEGASSCSAAADSLAAGVDAALFLDDDVELPSDDEDE